MGNEDVFTPHYPPMLVCSDVDGSAYLHGSGTHTHIALAPHVCISKCFAVVRHDVITGHLRLQWQARGETES